LSKTIFAAVNVSAPAASQRLWKPACRTFCICEHGASAGVVKNSSGAFEAAKTPRKPQFVEMLLAFFLA
jgi:hypothetical protein